MRGKLIGMVLVMASSGCGDDDGGTTPPVDAGRDAPPVGDLGSPPDARTGDATDDEDAATSDAGARVEATVGTAGGELRSADGRAVLTIPAGALATDTTLSIEPVDGATDAVVGAAYDIEPSGTTFARPVTLRIDASTVELGDVAPEHVALSLQTGATRWEMVEPQVRTVRASEGVSVTGLLEHLSRYAVTYVHEFPRGECVECAREDWDACCATGLCTTGSGDGALALVQGPCRMSVLDDRFFETLESFQACYGRDRGNTIGPCSTCQVECAMGTAMVAGAPTRVLGWRTTDAHWSTAELCTALVLDPPWRPEDDPIGDCFRECLERGEGNLTCGPDDRDAGPPDPPDAGVRDASVPDAGPPDTSVPDVGPPDAGCECDVDPICEATCLCDPDCVCDSAVGCGPGLYCDPDTGCTACTAPTCVGVGFSCESHACMGGRGVCIAYGTDCTRCECMP